MAGKMRGSIIKSNKYIRNPREKGWMLGRRTKDGKIECLYDIAFAVDWSDKYGILWSKRSNAEYYIEECKKWPSYHKEELFIIRVNSKKCPIEIDFVNETYRSNHGNVGFKLK